MVLKDGGARALPTDTIGMGEQIFHQGRLARQLDLDWTITEATLAAGGNGSVVSLDSVDSVLHTHEFDITIVRLTSDALHDDVDGLLAVIQDTRVATKEGNDLRTLGTEGNLQK